jgi:hypothetical protein
MTIKDLRFFQRENKLSGETVRLNKSCAHALSIRERREKPSVHGNQDAR